MPFFNFFFFFFRFRPSSTWPTKITPPSSTTSSGSASYPTTATAQRYVAFLYIDRSIIDERGKGYRCPVRLSDSRVNPEPPSSTTSSGSASYPTTATAQRYVAFLYIDRSIIDERGKGYRCPVRFSDSRVNPEPPSSTTSSGSASYPTTATAQRYVAFLYIDRSIIDEWLQVPSALK